MAVEISVTFAELDELHRLAREETVGRIDEAEYVRRVAEILGPERFAVVKAAGAIGTQTMVEAS